MTDTEFRWIEIMVDKYDLMVLELAVRHVPDSEMDHYVPLNDDAKFVYAGNVRQLKTEINTICKPDSETAKRLHERIDEIIYEQDEAKEVVR